MRNFKESAAGLQIATAPTDKLGFHGAAPVVQATVPPAAEEAAGSEPTAAEFDAAVALLNSLRTALIAKGLVAPAA